MNRACSKQGSGRQRPGSLASRSQPGSQPPATRLRKRLADDARGNAGLHRQFGNPQPPGLVVLHPPSSTLRSVPEYEVASGCLFLPGLPHLGLDHRAAWVEADREGTVTQLVSRAGIDPSGDADTAALAMLLAAA